VDDELAHAPHGAGGEVFGVAENHVGVGHDAERLDGDFAALMIGKGHDGAHFCHAMLLALAGAHGIDHPRRQVLPHGRDRFWLLVAIVHVCHLGRLDGNLLWHDGGWVYLLAVGFSAMAFVAYLLAI
jgi:hypothetical protein